MSIPAHLQFAFYSKSPITPDVERVLRATHMGRTMIDGFRAYVWIETPEGTLRHPTPAESAIIDHYGAGNIFAWQCANIVREG